MKKTTPYFVFLLVNLIAGLKGVILKLLEDWKRLYSEIPKESNQTSKPVRNHLLVTSAEAIGFKNFELRFSILCNGLRFCKVPKIFTCNVYCVSRSRQPQLKVESSVVFEYKITCLLVAMDWFVSIMFTMLSFDDRNKFYLKIEAIKSKGFFVTLGCLRLF